MASLLTRSSAATGLSTRQYAPAWRVAAAPRPHVAPRRSHLAQATTGSKAEKKVLKREEEPEEYWVSKGERKGANPMSDPLAIIGVTAIFLPFVLLGIAIATGLVDLSVYR